MCSLKTHSQRTGTGRVQSDRRRGEAPRDNPQLVPQTGAQLEYRGEEASVRSGGGRSVGALERDLDARQAVGAVGGGSLSTRRRRCPGNSIAVRESDRCCRCRDGRRGLRR